MAGLTGKVVLITGASSGIGAATAAHLASLGCKLALVARSEAKLAEVGRECEKQGAEKVFLARHDLADSGECKKAVEETVQHYGGLDVLVNNAGLFITSNLEQVTDEEFDACMALNVRSAMRLTQLSVEHLAKSRAASVVNVSSIAGLKAYPGAMAYKCSKAAMDQLTRVSALELAPRGIRVNSVNPGVIETELFTRAGMSDDAIGAYYERCRSTHPIGRTGRPAEVAKVVAFLASTDASFVVGQTLAVDGGRGVGIPV